MFDRAADTSGPESDSEEAPAVREGLPPSYRMRHDPHYVDQIASRRHAEPVHLVPVGHIDGPHPVQAPRGLQPLVESIRSVGVLQPLLVRRSDGRYQLIAGARRLAAAIAAGLTEVPCLVHAADDERARKLAAAEAVRLHRAEEDAAHDTPRGEAIPPGVFGEITERLDAIGACLQLFGDRDRPLRERVAIDLVQAELQRAGWLSQALSVLVEEPAMASNPVQVGPLIERLLEASAPERLFSGVEFDFAPPAAPCSVQGDEQLLAMALMGMLLAVHALVERVPEARAGVRLSLGPQGHALVVVSQSLVTLPAAWRARFFDLSWRERPGGAGVGAALLAARRVAVMHGGQLVLNTTDRQGCALTMSVPTT